MSSNSWKYKPTASREQIETYIRGIVRLDDPELMRVGADDPKLKQLVDEAMEEWIDWS